MALPSIHYRNQLTSNGNDHEEGSRQQCCASCVEEDACRISYTYHGTVSSPSVASLPCWEMLTSDEETEDAHTRPVQCGSYVAVETTLLDSRRLNSRLSLDR